VNRVAFALLWAFVFVIPWEEIVHLPGLGSLPRLIGILACVVGALHVIARGSLRPLSKFHVFAGLFVLWAAVSGYWSIDPEATRVRVLTYVQLTVLAWLIWELAWSPAGQRALLEAYVLGACLGAGGVVRSYWSGVALDPTSARFTGLNANPNDLGLTLALALPIAWYLGLSSPRRRIGWAWLLYVPLGMTAILLTASRGAFAAGVVGLLIIPWTLGRLPLATKVTVCVLGLATVVLGITLVPTASLDRIRSTRADIESGYFGGRGVIWQSGLDIVAERPFAGVGAGAFGAAVAPTLGEARSSHQTFLAVQVEEGIVGLSLFLAMALALVGATMTSLPRLPRLQRNLAIFLLGVLAAGSLSAAWDYKKQLWFVLGLLAAQAMARVVPGERAPSLAVDPVAVPR